ncbi:glutathione S-transferase N-terminal domain-containing protein [Ponticoccus litoralis]|uniref:Glutathione S-transferase N-terminal domain-containing protein n=1 Tax=Ponticoccus litoralis TaxID=422297 RepID=A0AAW9SCN1_9RHOB
MPIDPAAAITITAYDWVPDFARGQVRDLRVRWALEETGQNYAVRYLSQGQQKEAAHRALQPFGQVPTYEEGDLTLFESGAIVWHVAERFPGLRYDGASGAERVAGMAVCRAEHSGAADHGSGADDDF